MNTEKTLDLKALHNIAYGLYVVTSNDGKKDNGLIVNTVIQVTSTPTRVSVTINKQNYSHDVIRSTGKMNVNCLDITAPFALFQNFGFRSGRETDKFAGLEVRRSQNGLSVLTEHINAWMSLQVVDYLDLGTHGMFLCDVTEAGTVAGAETMTYSYYHKEVKPKPQPREQKKKGYVCKICGWVYEGNPLPEDIVCPVCKHGYEDFEPLK